MRPICARLASTALLGLFCASAARAQQPAASTGAQAAARVSGQLVSTTGAPIPKATLRLIANNPAPAGTATQPGQINTYVEISGSDGSFAFEGLTAGRYTLSAQKPGFTNAPSTQQASYTLAAGENKSNIRFLLMSLGTISGHVFDRDGDPVANVQMQVMRYAFQQGRTRLQMQNSTNTDERGQFRLGNLQPGRYFVRAEDITARFGNNSLNEFRGVSARESNIGTFYPSSPDLRGAARIDVQAGAEVSGVDIRMVHAQTYLLKGKVLDDSGQPMQAQLTLMDKGAEELANIGNPVASSQLPDGLFQFSSLPPGDYLLNVRGTQRQPVNLPPQADAPLSAQLQSRLADLARANAGSILFGRFEVSVRANMADVILRLAPGVTITGHVTLEGGGKLGSAGNTTTARVTSPSSAGGPVPVQVQRPLQFLMNDVDGNTGTVVAAVQPDGTFTIPNVIPTRYSIANIAQLGQQGYLKSIQMGGQDISSQYLDFRTGSGGPLELVIGTKPGQVSGAALDSKGDAASNVWISIWAKTPRLADQTSSTRVLRPANGTFTNQSLPPGDYFVAAWEDVDQQLLQNADFLSRFNSAAAAFKVEEGISQTVEPKWISKEASSKIADRFPE